LCRKSFVLAIGGGAILDVAGYAAATAHRGVRLIRVPTTTLSQADSGVGVKNGINAFGKKNYLGSFAVPWAVVNDAAFLATLSDREWRAGFSEAVKVALLKDARLFERIARRAEDIRARDTAAAVPILERSALLHYRHITEGGDPFEASSARPLDFGHWSAHKLEQITGYHTSHGDAVAIGLALDVVYSGLTGVLDGSEVGPILACLDALGFDLWRPEMADTDRLLGGVEEFRQHLGGRLTLTMLQAVGRPVEVHHVDAERMRAAVAFLGARNKRATGHANDERSR
jgi:3-dehydroquinate synthase